MELTKLEWNTKLNWTYYLDFWSEHQHVIENGIRGTALQMARKE